MTLRHLKIFVAVYETGSTVLASQKLYIAQPSVSLAISELEKYYGICLFDRIGKRLFITESGKEFLQYASHIVGLFDDMEKEVKDFDKKGVMRIGASITIGNFVLANYINKFKKMRPNINAVVTIANSNIIQQKLINNEIDIGLIEGHKINEYIVCETFMKDKLTFICPSKHEFANNKSINIEDMLNQNWLLREKGSASREVLDSFLALKGIKINPLWESVSTQALINAVSSGLGVSILPNTFIQPAVARKEVSMFEVIGFDFKRTYSIVYHKNKFLTPSAKDFMAICKETN